MFINLCQSRKKDEKLYCHKDERDETSMHDNHAIGEYKQEKRFHLVGHVPIECLTLVDSFSNAGKENRLMAVVTGKQKREVGLSLPAKFARRRKNRNIATILY